MARDGLAKMVAETSSRRLVQLMRHAKEHKRVIDHHKETEKSIQSYFAQLQEYIAAEERRIIAPIRKDREAVEKIYMSSVEDLKSILKFVKPEQLEDNQRDRKPSQQSDLDQLFEQYQILARSSRMSLEITPIVRNEYSFKYDSKKVAKLKEDIDKAYEIELAQVIPRQARSIKDIYMIGGYDNDGHGSPKSVFIDDVLISQHPKTKILSSCFDERDNVYVLAYNDVEDKSVFLRVALGTKKICEMPAPPFKPSSYNHLIYNTGGSIHGGDSLFHFGRGSFYTFSLVENQWHQVAKPNNQDIYYSGIVGV
eukprot:gene4103-4790_t